MRRFCALALFVLLLSAGYSVKAQTDIYLGFAGETIFSLGNVDAGADPMKDVVRFAPFFNLAQQVHFDFSKLVGFYTGLGVRNVGLISHTVEGYKIKERSYGLGIPLVLKIGNLAKGINLGLGGEAELMFAWKRKIFVGDTKTKNAAWFSDNVNIFNPSLLAEVRFYKGTYIRFKYYLDDFLNYQGLVIPTPTLPTTTKTLPEYGKSSQLMYISIGTVVTNKKSSSSAPSGTQTRSKKADGFFEEANIKPTLFSQLSN